MKTILFLIFALILTSYAQLPHTFTLTARNIHYGSAQSVAVGPDGTVFLANHNGGLRAYTYDGISFTNTAHIDDGGHALDVAVGSDGTVFLANSGDGLRAYSYDGISFTNTAHIDDIGDYGGALDVAVGSDGTVFLARDGDGLRAYTYDGTSFTNTAHIDDGGSAQGVAVGSDGTVFLANDYDGLRAYSYNGTSFTNTAHIDDGGSAQGVAVGPDGTLFLANHNGGLRAYTYNGTSFTNTAHIDDGGDALDVAIDSNGTVFLANDGLHAYTYDGTSFTNTAHTEGSSKNVAVGSDGTIFEVNYHGLRAYTYDGTSFTDTAYIDNGGYARGVAVGADGTVFLANSGDGLRAYSYNGTSFTNTAQIYDGGHAQSAAVGSDGTIFLANGGGGLLAYTYDGTSFTNTAHTDDGGEALGVAVGSDGTVFLANSGDGLRAYTYDGTSFTNTAHIDDGDDYSSAQGIAVSADGTVFLANGSDGLRAYTYDGTSFTNTAHIDDGYSHGSAKDVAVGSDGTVFLALETSGLRAYTYDGTSFTNTAFEFSAAIPAWNVTVGSDGTVFLALGSGGMGAYTYDGTSFTNTAHIYDDGEALDVALGSNSTIFLANDDEGLIAYTYSGYTNKIKLNSPSNLTSKAIGRAISLTWLDNSDDEDGFIIERKKENNVSWNHVKTTTENITNFDHADVELNETYSYRVNAYKGTEYSDYSNESEVVVMESPSELIVENMTINGIWLSWNDNTDLESGYILYRRNEDEWLEIANLAPNTTSYLDEDVSSGAEYTYRIRAFSEVEDVIVHYSGYSNTIKIIFSDYPMNVDLTVNHAEINQAIQKEDNSIKLISGKPTVVRVYVNTAIEDKGVHNVTGYLNVYDKDGQFYSKFLPDPVTLNAIPTPKQDRIDHTLNFYLGTLYGDKFSFKIVLDPYNSIAETNKDNNEYWIRDKQFISKKDLHIIYDIIEQQGELPDEGLASSAHTFFEKTYPIGVDNLDYHQNGTFKIDYIADNHWRNKQIHFNLSRRLVGYNILNPTNQADFIFGILPEGGLGTDNKGRIITGNADVLINSSIVCDGAEYIRQAFAHEMGHQYGLFNYPEPEEYDNPDASPVGTGGFNVFDKKVIPVTFMNFMNSEPEKRSWVNDTTYEHLIDGIDNLKSQKMLIASNANSRQIILISGIVNKDNSIYISPFYQFESSITENISEQGPYSIIFYDNSNSILKEFYFQPSFYLSGYDNSEVQSAIFSFILEYPEDCAKISFFKEQNLLTERLVSLNAPIHNGSGISLLNNNLYEVEWDVSDADNDTISTALMYSFNGSDWMVLADNISDNNYTFNADFFPGGDNCFIKIISTDGINTSESIISDFEIEKKIPQVKITYPADSTIFNFNDIVRFESFAFDREDGTIIDDNLSWYSSIDGDLGKGSVIEKNNLSNGEHVISLYAMDLDSNISNDQVTVIIDETTPIEKYKGEPANLSFALFQNFPNPFNATTSICFALPKSQRVRIEIFNLLGQKVSTLMDGFRQAGKHKIVWKADDKASGIYFYRLSTDFNVKTRKLLLLK